MRGRLSGEEFLKLSKIFCGRANRINHFILKGHRVTTICSHMVSKNKC